MEQVLLFQVVKALQGCLIENTYLGCQEVRNKLNQFPEKLFILISEFALFHNIS